MREGSTLCGQAGAPAVLALEDGTVFHGRAFGATGTVSAEVCFNTSMTGYQEILSDPSYHGQMVAMTAPHIGNTGIVDADDQSRRPWVGGLIVRDACAVHSSWRSEGSLADLLRRHGVPGITEVDTRRLTRHLRAAGAMRGALSSEGHAADELVDLARATPGLEGRDLAGEVGTQVPYRWGLEELTARAPGGKRPALALANGPRLRIAALDFGVKRNMLDLLAACGCDVTVLPGATEATEVLDGGFDGVFMSNGPGDPEPLGYAIDAARQLLGRMPLFGICLGHQILALAAGATTYKLKFGHRGGNHPVARRGRAQVEITCQNHGFAVDAGSLEGGEAAVTHTNLNDATVEGLEIPGAAFGVQYHPEAGPGPNDSRYLFAEFRKLIREFEPRELATT
jgi:carbamoyl-phosphate synthase small subunit